MHRGALVDALYFDGDSLGHDLTVARGKILPTMQSIQEAALALRSRRVSCVELVREALRAEEAHRDLNCFITLTSDEALREAEALDADLAAGRDRGPLHGI